MAYRSNDSGSSMYRKRSNAHGGNNSGIVTAKRSSDMAAPAGIMAGSYLNENQT